METGKILDRYPSTSEFRTAARNRTPHFAWEYLDSGTGVEAAISRNHDALDAVLFKPGALTGFRVPELKTELFGHEWRGPLGIAPVGLSGMIWPGSELALAKVAVERSIPYCLSMMACETPETIGEIAGEKGWYQHYPFADRESEQDLVRRAQSSGFETMVVTVDVPVNSTRERQRRAGLGNEKPNPFSRLAQMAARPAWLAATARRGAPAMRSIEKYLEDATITRILQFVRDRQMGAADFDHVKRLRDSWKGNFVVKGILDTEVAERCMELGADGIVVSNHGARQLDAAPASISVLPQIASAVGGRTKILFDSGIRTGLDVARALALGADFVLAGRAFMYGVCVAGAEGGGAVADMLLDDLSNNMMQIGVERPADLASRLA